MMAPTKSSPRPTSPPSSAARWVRAVALVMVLTGPIAPALAVQSCYGTDEEMLEFRFFTDAHSWSDNGWTLSCTDSSTGLAETIWQVPVGSLQYDESTEIIRYADCIPTTFMCTFTLEDFGGDGLIVEGENGLSGWFALVYGATTIDTYDGKEAFTQKTYCIGSACDQVPQEFAPAGDSCQVATLHMQLDGRPQDTAYTLLCDGEALWTGQDFVTPGQQIDEEACIPSTACCTFTVTDADTLGMTEPYVDATGTERHGYAYLEWDGEGLVEHDGVSGEEFDTLTVNFGYGCSQEDDSSSTTNGGVAAGTVDEDNEGQTDVSNESGNVFGDKTGDASTNTTTVEGGGPLVEDEYGDIAVIGASQNQSGNDGLSQGGMIAMISVAGLALFGGLAVVLFHTKAHHSAKVAVVVKDSEIL
jgi:hypothetical protein